MKKALMIVAIVALIAIAGSMIYYFVFFRTDKERAEVMLQVERLKYEKEQKTLEQTKIYLDKKDKEQAEANKKLNLLNALDNLTKWYDDGMSQIFKDYLIEWNDACKRLGLKPDSALPSTMAEGIDKRRSEKEKFLTESYNSQKEDIYKLYE